MLLIPFSHTVFVTFFRKMRKLSQLSFQSALGCCRICDLNFLSLFFFFLPCLLQFLLHASRPFNFRLEFLSFHYGRKIRILSQNYEALLPSKSVKMSLKNIKLLPKNILVLTISNQKDYRYCRIESYFSYFE